MACLQKFWGDITWGCGSGVQRHTLGKYTEAILINASDIRSFSAASVVDATITMNSGARGFTLNAVNNSIKVTMAKKGGDLFPIMYDPSVTVKVPSKLFSGDRGLASPFVNADAIIALKGSNGYTIFGLGAPLECTEIEGDSTASEVLTVTFGTGEGQTGSTIYGISKETYEALKVPAI